MHRAPAARAGLAHVALVQGHITAALVDIEIILAYLADGGTFDSDDQPLRIYLTCYQVLSAAGDPRAQRVLTIAHTLLQERAATLPDEKLQRSFLENVPYHREILAAWAEVQSGASGVGDR